MSHFDIKFLREVKASNKPLVLLIVNYREQWSSDFPLESLLLVISRSLLVHRANFCKIWFMPIDCLSRYLF